MRTCRVADQQTAKAGVRKDLTKRSSRMTTAAAAEETIRTRVVRMSKGAFLVVCKWSRSGAQSTGEPGVSAQRPWRGSERCTVALEGRSGYRKHCQRTGSVTAQYAFSVRSPALVGFGARPLVRLFPILVQQASSQLTGATCGCRHPRVHIPFKPKAHGLRDARLARQNWIPLLGPFLPGSTS